MAENIYNWDEKEFLIGFGHAVKRIMTSAQASSGGLGVAGQPARSPHPWKVHSQGVSTAHRLGFSCLVGVRL
jgi:hypothetical protein